MTLGDFANGMANKAYFHVPMKVTISAIPKGIDYVP